MDDVAKLNAIKGIHLFPGLPDDKLRIIAASFQDVTFTAGEIIFHQKDPADSFYVIAKGKVEITRNVTKKKTEKVGTLIQGDYFGETAIVRKTVRNATAKAETDITLLKMTAADFNRLRKSVPKLAIVFDIVAEGRSLLQHYHFEWRDEGEMVYYVAKRDFLKLLNMLKWPILITLGGLLFFAMGWGAENTAGNTLWLTGIPAFLFGVGWSIWNYVDWGNDYYAITNNRVVFKEKVVGIHDSRSEALLSAIRSVSVEMEFWDRQFDSGSVIITTYTGKFRIDDVNHPRQVAAMVEEYWNRTKRAVEVEQKESMHNLIRNRIAPPPAPPKPAASAAAVATTAAKPKKERFSLRKMFLLRAEMEGSITYHKHWYVLFRDSWFKVLLMILLLGVMIAAPIFMIDWKPVFLIAGLILSLIFIYWFIWDYGDWNNDLYLVTKDKIVDIYKKPLGLEQRKDAPLANILTMEYQRKGIIGNLLNFGDVKIEMGGSIIFTFTDVFDPPGVQNDISRRLNQALKKKQEQDAQNERAQMLNFIADYHNVAEELRRANPPK